MNLTEELSMVEPDTRPSLLLRLRDSQDEQAWREFISLYEPLLLRMMRQRGLQEADACDVAQQVVLAVSQTIERWQPDGRRASFRRWLFRIARNQSLKFLERGRPFQLKTGGTDLLDLLRSLPEPEQQTVTEFDDEYRNQVFHLAAEKIQCEFSETTWRAFWRTCVLNEPVAHVAKDLEMSAGAVYVARSRIIARLRKCVEEYEADHA